MPLPLTSGLPALASGAPGAGPSDASGAAPSGAPPGPASRPPPVAPPTLPVPPWFTLLPQAETSNSAASIIVLETVWNARVVMDLRAMITPAR